MPVARTGLQEIVRILQKQKIVAMEELKNRLGVTAERTLYRKLKLLSYRTSYTHGGSYFTLNEITDFNEDGLWSHDSVWFSQYGTLLATLEVWVTESVKGYFAKELNIALHASVKETLLRLVKSGRISREKTSGLYLYCSAKASERKRRLLARKTEKAAEEPSDELKASILLFFAVLDEKQRRLFVGLESVRHGRGGDTLVAELFGINAHTVAKGRRQLLERDVEIERIRATGGGRKRVQKKLPTSSIGSKT
jgi:hypothetical protein